MYCILGGKDIVDDTYENSIYLCKMEEDGSMKTTSSEITLPYRTNCTDDHFGVVSVGGHIILLFYIIESCLDQAHKYG